MREFWTGCPGTLDSDIDIFLPPNESVTERGRPCVFVLCLRGRPVALMAARIDSKRFAFRFGWLRLFNPKVNVLTIRGGLRGDVSEANCGEFVRAVYRCLKEGHASVAYFAHVDADSELCKLAKREPGFLFRDYFPPVRQHRKRRLSDSVESLYAGLSGHERKRFRQIAKKLLSEFPGKVRLERFETPVDLDRTLAVVEEIAKKTWQRAMNSGFKLSQAETLRIMADKGWLRVYTLYLADKPCAFWIGFLYHGTFVSEYTGYDQDYANYSLGTYLLSQLMEECCSGGVDAIDFGSSDEEYKKRFGNVVSRETSLHMFAPTLMGFSLSLMRIITVVINEPARAFLKRTNLIQKAKKTWRGIGGRREKIRAEAE